MLADRLIAEKQHPCDLFNTIAIIAQQNSLDPILDTPISLGAVAFQKLLPLIRF
jgi:hypothetical protein